MLRKKTAQERRRYLRLTTVFPVQFRIVAVDGKQFVSGWLQGYTNNIGKGGICLVVNHLNPEFAGQLQSKQAKLSLDIEMPISKHPIHALATVSWMRSVAAEHNKYMMGLCYEDIDAEQNQKIMRYAWTKKLFVPVVSAVIFTLGVGFLINSAINLKMARNSRALVVQVLKIRHESYATKQKIKEINQEREDLQFKILEFQTQIKSLEEEKQSKEEVKTDEIKKLNFLIGDLIKEKNALEEQLGSLQAKENLVTTELLRLDKKRAVLEKAKFDKLIQWLRVRQNPRTGLVVSFEGDNELANWAFTYDQALMIQVYTYFGDFERARKLIEFFAKKAKRIDGRFLNAYYANDASPVEYTVHSGPNIWLGIAIVQYTRKTGDRQFFGLAEEIGQSIIYLQEQDPSGGIRGGPNVEWYATEHNLDAYAFFDMLHTLTNSAQYVKARDKVLAWLLAHTYDQVDTPIKRGKGDATIATDTYAWSIAAIGPDKLQQIGMDPDRIVEFAEKNCSVEVDFVRPEGEKVRIKGFDFAPQRHLARGGVVSSEWTAQMVLAFKITADFYRKKGITPKAIFYVNKADDYLAELGKMIISSYSPSGQGGLCLPYATTDYVDTGHGWMTPKGNYTGSVAGTAYTIFAYFGFNPLELTQ